MAKKQLFRVEKNLAVLQAVCARDDPLALDHSLRSVFRQTVLPSEYLICVDGPVPPELTDVLHKWKKTHGGILRVYKRTEQMGLGSCLNHLLRQTELEYLARMDSDDICRRDRFQKQIDYLMEYKIVDVVGSSIIEFGTSRERFRISKPCTHRKIQKNLLFNNPIAHPSTMIRSRFFKKICGGYRETPEFDQDVDLWVKGIESGCIFANINEELLYFRINKNFYSRRFNLTKNVKRFIDRLRWRRQLRLPFFYDFFIFSYFFYSFLPAELKYFLRKVR